MRYLGGKTQISKKLALKVNEYRKPGQEFWDPFCGSLAMGLALGPPGLCSDIHPALIHMYKAILDGWDPPETLSKEEWLAAKELPVENPLHGFAGFGCSFRGLYFSGYAGGYVGPVSNPGAYAARKVLKRDLLKIKLSGIRIEQKNFFDVEPHEGPFLYLDPPYRNTAGYAGTPDFDHEGFVERVRQWSQFGPVCISEYDFPIGEVVWTKSRAKKMIAGSGERALEKLYVVQK